MTIRYDIGTPRKDGKMRISLILTVGNTKKRIHTDLFAHKTDLTRQGKLRNDTSLYEKVTDAIRQKEREFGSLDTFLTGEKISANDAYSRMGQSNAPMFFVYTEKWLERTDIKGKKNYVCAINSFKKFLKGQDIAFKAFSYTLLSDWSYSLRNTKRAQSMYLSAIKKIYNDAEREYDITLFSKFRFEIPRQKKSVHRALDTEIVRQIFAYQGTLRRTILARDCCILSFCLCATNAADLYSAPKIRNGILAYERTKTRDRRIDNAYIEITIPEQIKPLIRKYKGTTKAFCFSQDYKHSDDFGRAINIGLKEIQRDIEKRLKIKLPPLTFYAIRHSYATIARNEAGIDKATVHELLNHIDSDTAIDDIYIKKDYSVINVANQKVVDYVLGKNASCKPAD